LLEGNAQPGNRFAQPLRVLSRVGELRFGQENDKALFAKSVEWLT
jgi:hypothetical protein